MPNELDALRAHRTEYQHPKLRFWTGQRDAHPERVYRLELLRPRQGLTFGPARLYVHVFDEAGTEVQAPDEMMWEPDLDEAFIQAGFRGLDEKNEILRFSLALKTSFSKPERRYGEGYFNSVLHQWVSRSPFGPRLRPILDEIHAGNALEGRDTYTDCRDQIQAAMEKRADDLTERLRWDQAAAAAILREALGAYLDERFNITNRRALGLGSSRRG